MRKLKLQITYDAFLGVLDRFPNVTEGVRDTLEQVKAMASEEFATGRDGVGREDWGIIYGDFWTGKYVVHETYDINARPPLISLSNSVLISNPLGPVNNNPIPSSLHIIDWEFTQLGHHAYDLGQMIGDLCEFQHFQNAECAPWALRGLVEGYGEMSNDLLFRTVIHAGVHIICWCTRHPNPKHSVEHIEAAMRIGVDFIVKGWERDHVWFEGSMLACFFSQRSE